MKKIQITYEKPENLIPYVNNHKIHSDEQILRLASSIQEFGFDQPIVVDKNNIIIKGHGRREAAIKLNLKTVPVFVAEHLDEYQVKAARIADNKSASNEYNNDLLKFDIKTLELKEFNLPSLAIRSDELLELLKDVDVGLKDFEFHAVEEREQLQKIERENKIYEEKQFVEDVIPEVKEPRAKIGQVFKLGIHRLMCGDSTSEENAKILMNGEKADVVFTYPPYNLQERGQLKRTNKTDKKNVEFGDWDIGFDPLKSLPIIDFCSKENSHRFICTSNYLFGKFHDWLEEKGDKTNYLVWCKKNPMPSLSKKTFVQATELIVHGRKGSPEFNYPVGENLPNFFSGNVEPHEFGHPSQKPIYVVEYCIKNTVGSVVDLFGGSGSTLIACEKANRISYTMELDPKYVDVILARWEKYTGLTAELIS